MAEWKMAVKSEKSLLTKISSWRSVAIMTQNSEIIKEPRINISIVGEEALLIEKLQAALQRKLMIKLSTAQVIKHLVRQAALAEQIS